MKATPSFPGSGSIVELAAPAHATIAGLPWLVEPTAEKLKLVVPVTL
jgi:hypothetical protein